MRIGSRLSLSCALLALAVPALAANPHIHRGPTASRSHGSRSAPHAAVGISPDRATQIQSALIQSGYMTGTPTGIWDKDSIAAMQKMQAANGWQTKLVPDSRAIIKLGLGPGSTPATTLATESGTATTASQEQETSTFPMTR